MQYSVQAIVVSPARTQKGSIQTIVNLTMLLKDFEFPTDLEQCSVRCRTAPEECRREYPIRPLD